MLSYTLTQLATDDLVSITTYTRRTWGDEQASSYYDQIIAQLELIAETPFAAASCDRIKTGYRRKQVGMHMVYFYIDGDRIVVARILHGHMDPQRHL
jgi:toxin ParE1/3/4